MGLTHLRTGLVPPVPRDSRIVVQTPEGPRRVGHAHFWERALSRRQLVKAAAGTTAAVLGSGLWLPALARAADPGGVLPKPIPGGIQPFGPGTEVFHLFLPARGNEPSTITDFNGMIGIAHIEGTGTGSGSALTTSPETLSFDADTRFMQGVYVGVDGRVHQGTFAFF